MQHGWYCPKPKGNRTVKDTEGLEVIGATVTVPGTKAAAITDVDGKYTIDVPSGGKKSKLRMLEARMP